MTSTDSRHRELCHRFFDAIETGDFAAVDGCYSPDVELWFNVSPDRTQTREESLATLRDGAPLHRRRTYDDRQIHTFEDGFMVQYSVNVVAHDGSRHSLPACVVAEVRDDRISKLFEYFDMGRFARRR